MLNKLEEKTDKNKRKSENFNRSWIRIYKGNQNGHCKLGTCNLIGWASEYAWLRRGQN